MRCLVAVKQVIDPYVHIRINEERTAVIRENVKMSMNPFDEIAMEAAQQFKEQGILSEVIVVSIGSLSAKETLRQALARGADQAIFIPSEEELNPLAIAKILSKITLQHTIDLVLMGKQAIDNDCNQTGQMLAALLDWPQATFVSELALNKQHVTATREVDGGLETIRCKLPAVITTDLRLNDPRVISLPNIMQAKKKPLTEIHLEELDLELGSQINTTAIKPPSKRKPGIKVSSVTELVEKLKYEEKVI